ncbi:protein ALTERED PHOSPHATE STARVATION RESPONSE 1-like isoform X2 [Mercurialis annua]|nr:protein ALTERED PHOSPHATE STARVATION RESPONSE 1-like isoform X2 [Mercurialis annua]
MPSPNRQFGWDFFYAFDEVRPDMFNGFGQNFDEDLRAVREKEGIPDLEDDGDKMMSGDKNVRNGDVSLKESGIANARSENHKNLEQKESKGLRVNDGRELLEALKDVEDHLLRCYDSGLDISRMLEANRVPLQSGLEEIKESSNKLIRSITFNRSTSSRSSSSKSLLTSTSTNSSVWTDFKAELFDDFGLEAGSHSLTLGRLYAWEKKLYEEVKTGDQTRKMYERKCSRLRRADTTRNGFPSLDKSTIEIKELQSRISVAIRSVESISDRIQKLRDEELQPQLLELLHGLMRNWKMMLESHETQSRIMLEVKSFNCPAYGKFSNESHRLATLQLEAEIDNWHMCFAAYVPSQKAYIDAMSSWLSKFIAPEVEFYSGGKYSLAPCRTSGPPLLVTCHGWLAWMDTLPENAVTYAMKSFGKDIHALWYQQGKEKQLKRKVDGLAKELDRRAVAFQRAERKILMTKLSEQETEVSVSNRLEYLTEGKILLDMFRKRLDEEKEKHLNSMQETQQITISSFQTGFSSVFESLAEFSKASVKMYADLVTYSANAKTAVGTDSNVSYIDGLFS